VRAGGSDLGPMGWDGPRTASSIGSGDVFGPPGSFTMHEGNWGIGPGHGGGGRLLRRRWPTDGG
jgi:hypothetical protein